MTNKRNDAHKNALGKVSQHLKLAKSAHGRGMASLAECAKCMVDAKKLSKAADGNDLASHLTMANGHFEKAASSMEDAQAHLNQALSHFNPYQVPLMPPRGYSRSESNDDPPIPSLAGAVTPSLDDMTEGSVSQFSSYLPYPAQDEKMASAGAFAKNAAATAFAKMMRSGQGRHVITTPRWR